METVRPALTEGVLSVAGLRKSYAGREVVAGISFNLARGEC